MNYRDLFSGIAFLIIGITTAWMGKSFYGDAAYVPIGAGALMGVFSLGLIWRSVANLRARREPDQLVMPLVESPVRFTATLACTLVYYAALPIVGFYTTSTLFILLLALVLGERRPLVILGITLSFIILLYGLFALILKRPLPVEFFLAY